MIDIHIPFQPSKRQKESMIKKLIPKLKKYVWEETLKELQHQLHCHAVTCDKCINDQWCGNKDWLDEYMEAFREDMFK